MDVLTLLKRRKGAVQASERARQRFPEDYQVHLAESAEEAFEMLNRLKRIDAVVVDVRLPGMDGLEFVRRARESCPDLKVFVMTAYDKERAPKDAFEVRADGYLSKPFQMETLKDMLASHLSGVPL